ncbi:MAG TPA: hypothetical protein VMY37_02775 [Thermoguttaceae bacterium]|nr:hypothetical protein [Thermoguttaceae bacterium]
MAKSHKWAFKARFRAKAYGWRGTALASKRLKEAVSEIKKVAKSDPVLAADSIVALMERLWPSLEAIDTSSGALGTAVNRTLDALIPLLINAPADIKTRAKWLDRLYEAVLEDGVEYLMPVEDRWGEICGFPELANQWADRMLPFVRDGWSRNEPGGWVDGATLCLSSLLRAERYAELEQLLSLHKTRFWHFDKFQAEALARQGRTDEAIHYAEACRRDQYDYNEHAIATFCERVLLEAGRREEAYQRYGLIASQATTNLAAFRRLAKKYAERDPRQILLDLIETWNNEGKWFAAAKDAGHLDIALECAGSLSAEPATLIRAARDFAESEPAFATQVSLCAIAHLLAGRGYEPTTLDILRAYDYLAAAAANCGRSEWAVGEIEKLIAKGASPGGEPMLQALTARLQRHRSSET